MENITFKLSSIWLFYLLALREVFSATTNQPWQNYQGLFP